MNKYFKSREEMIKIAEDIGIEIKFDSENAGVTFLNEDGTVNSHKGYDEILIDFENHLGIKFK